MDYFGALHPQPMHPEGFTEPLETMVRQGYFVRAMNGLAAEHGAQKTVLNDVSYLKGHQKMTGLCGKNRCGRSTCCPPGD